MPTVILLDVSLSMCRPACKTYNASLPDSRDDAIEVRQLANVGIGILLDYFAQNSQLEHTSLVVFSSLWEMRTQFTRNHELIKNDIYGLELYDKSNVVNALRGILSLKLDEWAQSGTINIILITDGQIYHNDMGGRSATRDQQAKTDFHDIPLGDLKGLFDFPCKIQVVNLTSPRDPALKYSMKFYKDLVLAVDPSATSCPVLTSHNLRDFKQSAIWLPESNTLDVTLPAVEELFTSLAELHYKPYHVVLSFGHLSSMVLLSPKPTENMVQPPKNEFDDSKNRAQDNGPVEETFVSSLNKVSLFKLNEEISICGFIPLNEIASPAITSRHHILPVPHQKFNEISKAEQILSQDPNAYGKAIHTSAVSSTDDAAKLSKQVGHARTNKHIANGTQSETNDNLDVTKQPSFCVLLHNCLKHENLVAICLVGKSDETNEDWYGFLHPHIDSRKRSSLILSLLLPGSNPIPWLPAFRTMCSIALNADLHPTILERIASQRGPTKSYSSNSVIWLDPESVQADVQKIVRYAKRGPDKAPQFYKELNRIRRAAISYGFFDVLSGLASILERERRILASDQSKPANQEMAKHLDHVIFNLKTDLTNDSYDINILPST